MAQPAVSYTTVSRVPSFKRFFSIPKRPDWLWLLPSFVVDGFLGHFPGLKGPGHEADHLELFPRLRLSKISTSTTSYTYLKPQSVQLGRQYSRSQQTSFTSLHRHPVWRGYWELSLKRSGSGVDYAISAKYRTGRLYFHHAAAHCHLGRLGCIVP